MAITSPEGFETEQIASFCTKHGMPTERGYDLVNIDNAVNMTTEADLIAAVNAIGYYDEKANHLLDAGMTFV